MISQDSFDSWNLIKKKLNKIPILPLFNEREIWWCSVGMNVGCEIFGKGRTFIRPVLILKKFSSNSFIAIPLTTKIKDRIGYHKFNFKEQEICAALNEMRKMDGKRMVKKIGKLSNEKFNKIKAELKKTVFGPL